VAIGVIVPVRAPAPFLGEALASVLGQDPAPDEVVVVDDASDEPVAVPDGVRLVRSAARAGPAAARAAGLAATAAGLIALADADDVWMPGKLAAQLAALHAHPDAALCFGRAEIVDAAGRRTGERWPELEVGLYNAEWLRSELFESNPIPAASVVLRREALEAVGGFEGGPPLAAGSDWELWLRLAAAGHAFVCEPRAVIRYRRHAGGVTADVAALAEAGLAIHEAHASLADEATRRRVRARELTALARGRIRQRRYREARSALREAAELEPAALRERLLSVVAAIPGARAALGRRDPYGGGAR
jgi:glycosyltransferase involved in cell wall biosynthesis